MPNTEKQSRRNPKGEFRKSILIRMPNDLVPFLEAEALLRRVSVNTVIVDLVQKMVLLKHTK